MKHTSVLAIFLVILITTGCTSSQSGRFEVDGVRDHAECLDRMFPFEPVFMAIRSRTESMGLFLQSKGGNFQNVDLIYFELYQIPSGVPASIELNQPGVTDPTAFGEIEIQGSCPDSVASLYLEGTLVLDEYNNEVGGVVAGHLEGASVHSSTDGGVVAGAITGDFSFVVRRGQPYEEFRRP